MKHVVLQALRLLILLLLALPPLGALAQTGTLKIDCGGDAVNANITITLPNEKGNDKVVFKGVCPVEARLKADETYFILASKMIQGRTQSVRASPYLRENTVRPVQMDFWYENGVLKIPAVVKLPYCEGTAFRRHIKKTEWKDAAGRDRESALAGITGSAPWGHIFKDGKDIFTPCANMPLYVNTKQSDPTCQYFPKGPNVPYAYTRCEMTYEADRADFYDIQDLQRATSIALAQRQSQVATQPSAPANSAQPSAPSAATQVTGSRIKSQGPGYEGDMVNGLRHGYGVLVTYGGDRYEGQWVNDKKEGQGVLVESDGTKYEGGWANNKRNGEGRTTRPSGRIIEGTYVNDELEGEVLVIQPNGDEEHRTYRDGMVWSRSWASDERERPSSSSTFLSAMNALAGVVQSQPSFIDTQRQVMKTLDQQRQAQARITHQENSPSSRDPQVASSTAGTPNPRRPEPDAEATKVEELDTSFTPVPEYEGIAQYKCGTARSGLPNAACRLSSSHRDNRTPAGQKRACDNAISEASNDLASSLRNTNGAGYTVVKTFCTCAGDYKKNPVGSMCEAAILFTTPSK